MMTRKRRRQEVGGDAKKGPVKKRGKLPPEKEIDSAKRGPVDKRGKGPLKKDSDKTKKGSVDKKRGKGRPEKDGDKAKEGPGDKKEGKVAPEEDIDDAEKDPVDNKRGKGPPEKDVDNAKEGPVNKKRGRVSQQNDIDKTTDGSDTVEEHNYSKDPKDVLMKINLPIYTCPVCMRYTFDPLQAAAHVRQVHNGIVGVNLMLPLHHLELPEKVSSIEDTNIKLAQSPEKASFKVVHSVEESPGRKYECSKCSRQFDRERQMNMHKCMDILSKRQSPRRGQVDGEKESPSMAMSSSEDAVILIEDDEQDLASPQSESEQENPDQLDGKNDATSASTPEKSESTPTVEKPDQRDGKNEAISASAPQISESTPIVDKPDQRDGKNAEMPGSTPHKSENTHKREKQKLDLWKMGNHSSSDPVSGVVPGPADGPPITATTFSVSRDAQTTEKGEDQDDDEGDEADEESVVDDPLALDGIKGESSRNTSNTGSQAVPNGESRQLSEENKDGEDDLVTQWTGRLPPTNEEIGRFVKIVSGGLQGGGGQSIEFYMCLICRKVFKTRAMAKMHVQCHLGYRPHVCSKCGFSTSHSSTISIHTKKHDLLGLQCLHKPCDYVADFQGDLKQHREENHTLSLTCELCHKIYKSQSTLLGHLCISHGSEIKDGAGLEFYRKMVVTGQKKTQIVLFECDICGLKTKTKKAYYTHVKIHTGGDTVEAHTSTAKLGDKTKRKKRRRNRRKADRLRGKGSLRCPMCEYRCHEERALISHLSIHPFIYRCCMCPKMFLTYGALNEHVSSHNDVEGFHPQEKINESLRKSMYVGGIKDKAMEADKVQWAQRRTGALAPQTAFTGSAFDELMSKISIPSETVDEDELKSMGRVFASIPYKKLTPSILRYIHLRFGNVECGVCGKLFTKVGHCKDHTKKHTQSREFKCSKCPFEANRKAPLQKHMFKQHKEGQVYSCAECKVDMYTLERYNKHMLRHSKENNGPFTCSWCNTVEENGESMRKHIMDTHPLMPAAESMKILGKGVKIHRQKDSPFLMCEVCNQTYRRICDLRRHMWKHSSVKRFMCEMCDYGSDKRSNIISHMKRHSTDKTYTCDICNKAYKSEQGVKQHFRTAHLKMKPFACELCDYAAAQPVHLRRHKAIHHTEGDHRRFRCAICPDYKASDLQIVRRHYKKKHPGEPLNYGKCVPPGAQNPSRAKRDKHQVIQVVPSLPASETNPTQDAAAEQEPEMVAEQEQSEQTGAQHVAAEQIVAEDGSEHAMNEVEENNMTIEVVLPSQHADILDINSTLPDVINALTALQESDFNNQ